MLEKKMLALQEKKVGMLRRKEKLVRGEPGENERSYVMQELVDHVVGFTFYFKSKWKLLK